MRLSDCKALIDREVTYPVDHGTVIDQVGEVRIDSLAGGTESIETVLDRGGHSRYRSPRELHVALVGNLDDDHVGRKHYDDRGTNYHDFEAVSF